MHPINTFIKKRTLQTKIYPFKTIVLTKISFMKGEKTNGVRLPTSSSELCWIGC